MSTVWSVPASAINRRQILEFLKDTQCSMRAVEVRPFKGKGLYRRAPIGSRRWEPSSDLSRTAEISKYLAENGSVEVTLLAVEEA